MAFLENMNFNMYELKCQSIKIMIVVFQKKASQGEHSNENYGNPTHMQSCVNFLRVFRRSVQCKNSFGNSSIQSWPDSKVHNLILNNYTIWYSIKSFELCNICRVHSIFCFSFFGQSDQKNEKISCHFQAKCGQDSWFFLSLVTLTKTQKTKNGMNQTLVLAWKLANSLRFLDDQSDTGWYLLDWSKVEIILEQI